MTQTPPPQRGAPRSSTTGNSDAGQEVLQQAHDKVSQVVDKTQDTAGQVAEQAKQQATSQLESQKTRAVDTLVTVGQALRQTGQHLRDQQQGTVGGYVEQAAERVEDVTNFLRTRDVATLLNETQELARRQPGVFLSGAIALGFIGARFLMSSGQRAAAQRSLAPASQTTYPQAYGQTAGFQAPPSSMYGIEAGATSAEFDDAAAEIPNVHGANRARGTTGALEA